MGDGAPGAVGGDGAVAFVGGRHGAAVRGGGHDFEEGCGEERENGREEGEGDVEWDARGALGRVRGRSPGDGCAALIDTVGREYDVALGVERWVWERRPDHTIIL